ncbi:MAG TPA: hypothetical protein DHV36_15745 [Desulfobacteraceae bacterium]|nr:hypothetical protein [Desulfobacteraceae bacterium]
MMTNRNIIFDDSAIQDAVAHARMCYPFEACGAVINDRFVPFENQARDRENNFLINDRSFDQAYRAGQVQAVIHSHNDHPHASQADQEQQQAMDIPFGIINLRNNSVLNVVFWGDGIPREPLCGRQFFYGVWDCFSLVRDFIRERWGLITPNPTREYGWWHKGVKVFEPFLEGGLPFKPVPLDKIQPDDILFYGLYGSPILNHCGVLMESGLILHHFESHLSRELPPAYQRQYLYRAYRLDVGVDVSTMPGWERKGE